MPLLQGQTTDDLSTEGDSSPKTVSALEAQIQHMKISLRYEQEMRRVFARLSPEKVRALKTSQGKPLGKRHQQMMLSTDFHHYLVVVWKESPFVSDGDRDVLGIGRSFEPGNLNSYRVGCAFAADKHAVGAATQRSAGFGELAAAYGLVERIQTHRKSIELRGTSLLNEVFLAVNASVPEALIVTSNARTNPHDPI